MAPKEASNLAVGPDMASTVSARLHGPLWVHVHVIATLNFTICAFLLLCLI